jgi:hypothetical protein
MQDGLAGILIFFFIESVQNNSRTANLESALLLLLLRVLNRGCQSQLLPRFFAVGGPVKSRRLIRRTILVGAVVVARPAHHRRRSSPPEFHAAPRKLHFAYVIFTFNHTLTDFDFQLYRLLRVFSRASQPQCPQSTRQKKLLPNLTVGVQQTS